MSIDISGPAPASAAPRPWTLGDRVLCAVAGVFVVLLLGTVSAGVVFRAVGHPLSWTDEAAGFLMVWLACLGWMVATRNQAHIRIRFFQDMVPRRVSPGFETVLQAGVALFGAAVAWYSVHLMRVNADVEAISMPLAVAWMYVPLLPAGLLTVVQALIEIRRQWAGAPRGGDGLVRDAR